MEEEGKNQMRAYIVIQKAKERGRDWQQRDKGL